MMTLKWTHGEFARRIVNSLVRNEYIAESQIEKCYQSLLKVIARDELDLTQCRELSHRMSRNASKSVRDRTAKKLIDSISLIPEKKYLKLLKRA